MICLVLLLLKGGVFSVLLLAFWLDCMEISPLVLAGAIGMMALDGAATLFLFRAWDRAVRKAQGRPEADQGKLLALLAHELKTRLSTLRMRMEVGLLRQSTLERVVTDMNQLIERCVHTAQLSDRGLRPVCQALDPAELTRVCIQSCQAPGRVVFHAHHGVPTLLHADAQMLLIVLSNLLDNACKYSAPDSPVSVALEAVPGRHGQAGLRWEVSNCVGMAGYPDAGQLFEKYYRSPQARRQSGSGLGLFLVRGLLDLMQGTIHYAQHSDGQVVFSVSLPQAMEPC